MISLIHHRRALIILFQDKMLRSLTAIVLSYLLACSVVESSTCRTNEQVSRHARIHTIRHAEVNGTVCANGPEFFDPENIRRRCQLGGYLI
jgi:hypothetical protein